MEPFEGQVASVVVAVVVVAQLQRVAIAVVAAAAVAELDDLVHLFHRYLSALVLQDVVPNYAQMLMVDA